MAKKIFGLGCYLIFLGQYQDLLSFAMMTNVHFLTIVKTDESCQI